MNNNSIKKYIKENIHIYTNYAALFILLHKLEVKYEKISFRLHVSNGSYISPIHKIKFVEDDKAIIWINDIEISAFMLNLRDCNKIKAFFFIFFSYLIKESLLFIYPEGDKYLAHNYRNGLSIINPLEGIINSYVYVDFILRRILSKYRISISYLPIEITDKRESQQIGKCILKEGLIIGDRLKITKTFYIIKLFSDTFIDKTENAEILNKIINYFIIPFMYNLKEINICIYNVLTDNELYSFLPSVLKIGDILTQRETKIFQGSFSVFFNKIYYSILG